ncbi:FtsB family cell division protein [Desertibacillus haloalkaliphilus]|uniref:FtsB family cell division protein n=1 Tax=Desertibacillus haloalkaliphilus TaxID=1328930 RepID=UPI001C26E5A0|nr:septum formation initiator family protein [Desertibacillus haloalkaliphilus]MBU8908440.1 septum formation initiator family protein [Desertibacillus haloalkaliphilus]
MGIEREEKIKELHSSYKDQQERQEKEKQRRRKGLVRRLTAMAVVAGFISIFAGITIYSQASVIDEKRQEKLQLEEQLQLMKENEQQLKIEIKNYNDLEYIAEVARKDYYLSKPGETIFKLPSETSSD